MILSLTVAALLAAPPVRVGLEQVEAQGGALVKGKRIGLLAHGASLTADGRHAVDVLRGLGVDVVRLFAPEHGLRGRLAAGAPVTGGVDPETALPLVSLYGKKAKPSAEDLAGLDALVVDLQDAGVRFYTYESTVLLCLEAAAEARIELVVLDRPNPLGGEQMDGPLRDPNLPSSLLSLAPGPLIHGLTLGELARLVNAGRERPAHLTVVPMQGWTRGMTWAETGRPWVAPSPNLRSAEAALAYPGVCLLEATNVSEGRGTEDPFLLLGAPWMKPDVVRLGVFAPGFALEPTHFTPRDAAVAGEPKYRDRECQGLRVRVTDPRAARPYALGLALLGALRRHHPEFRFSREGAGLDGLLGTRRVRDGLERGESLEAILAVDAPARDSFARDRRPALLY
ncbi:MAG TPA: DUF1343 domain-containing protein [Vicinamibacteria bacterium]|nr:DUF1343 domain-containing protein [Vicinamibacteria bacterium]